MIQMTEDESFARQGPPDFHPPVPATTAPCKEFMRLYQRVSGPERSKAVLREFVKHWGNYKPCQAHSQRVGENVLKTMHLPICTITYRYLRQIALGKNQFDEKQAFEGHLANCRTCCASFPCIRGTRFVRALYDAPSQATLDALGTHLDHCAVCQATLRTEQTEQAAPPFDWSQQNGATPSLAGTLKTFWKNFDPITLTVARSK